MFEVGELGLWFGCDILERIKYSSGLEFQISCQAENFVFYVAGSD